MDPVRHDEQERMSRVYLLAEKVALIGERTEQQRNSIIPLSLECFSENKKPQLIGEMRFFKMVDLTGLEPVTFSMSTKRSNQLS